MKSEILTKNGNVIVTIKCSLLEHYYLRDCILQTINEIISQIAACPSPEEYVEDLNRLKARMNNLQIMYNELITSKGDN